jgi:AcrR family transcriptional regulator
VSRPARSHTTSTREHILDSAMHVMHARGLARTTTREIAQAAGLSEAALYRHFTDKSDIFLCVLAERLPQLVGTLHDLPARVGKRTLRGNLEELARVALLFYDQTVPMLAAIFSEPELLARHQEMMRTTDKDPHRATALLAAYLRAEQRVGRVRRGVDVDAAATLLIGACVERVLMRCFAGETASTEADAHFARGVVRTLLQGLAPAPSTARAT